MITPLSAARIAGEVGLAGGTITSSAYAVKYGGQVKSASNIADLSLANAIVTEMDLRTKNANIELYTGYVEYSGNTLAECVRDGIDNKADCQQLLESLNKSLQTNLKIVK